MKGSALNLPNSSSGSPSFSTNDGSTLSIYEKLILAERREEAAALGIRVDELEESRAMAAAIESSQLDNGSTEAMETTTKDAGLPSESVSNDAQSDNDDDDEDEEENSENNEDNVNTVFQGLSLVAPSLSRSG